MSSDLVLINALRVRGDFANRRIVLADPDDPRTYQVYEDLDWDDDRQTRLALITLFPERSKAQARGDDESGMVVTTHHAALEDMARMVERHGYRIQRIARDIR